jgi:transcriptional antiterminator NusG
MYMAIKQGKVDKAPMEEVDRFADRKLADGTDASFKWYVVHVLSGHENKVCKALKERIFNHGLEAFFSEIFIPEESVVANVKGKKRTLKKKFFPGYILIKMVMNDRTWHLARSTDKVTGFLGTNKNSPTPMTDQEAMQLTSQAAEGFKRPKASSNLSEGDNVRVVEGPFSSFVGVVESVNDKGRVRVQVSIFGRPTPVELDFTQVEKV